MLAFVSVSIKLLDGVNVLSIQLSDNFSPDFRLYIFLGSTNWY